MSWFIEQETEKGAPSEALIGTWSITLETVRGECLTLPVWFPDEDAAKRFLADEVLPAATEVD